MPTAAYAPPPTAASAAGTHPLFDSYDDDAFRAPPHARPTATHAQDEPLYGYTPRLYPASAPFPSPTAPAAAARPAVLRRHHSTTPSRSRFTAFWATYNTPNQLAFLGLILFQAMAVLAMIALVYATTNSGTGDITSEIITADPQLESIATYLGLFILAEVFEVAVALDALQQKNIIQASLLLPFQAAMLVYSAVLPGQLHAGLVDTTAGTDAIQRRVRAYAIVIPSVIGACSLVLAGFCYRLYEEFGWDVFKRIGADIQLKRMYFRYQIFVCLLKYDAFFFVGFSIQFLVLVSGTPTAEFVITIASVPIILVCLVLAAIAVRLESRSGVFIFFALDFAGMAYFLYKLVRIFDPTSGDRYAVAKKTLTIFSIITFLMLLITFIMTGLCFLNFGRGLKEKIPPYSFGRHGREHRPSPDDGREKDSASPGAGLERHETRMSLD